MAIRGFQTTKILAMYFVSISAVRPDGSPKDGPAKTVPLAESESLVDATSNATAGGSNIVVNFICCLTAWPTIADLAATDNNTVRAAVKSEVLLDTELKYKNCKVWGIAPLSSAGPPTLAAKEECTDLIMGSDAYHIQLRAEADRNAHAYNKKTEDNAAKIVNTVNLTQTWLKQAVGRFDKEVVNDINNLTDKAKADLAETLGKAEDQYKAKRHADKGDNEKNADKVLAKVNKVAQAPVCREAPQGQKSGDCCCVVALGGTAYALTIPMSPTLALSKTDNMVCGAGKNTKDYDASRSAGRYYSPWSHCSYFDANCDVCADTKSLSCTNRLSRSVKTCTMPTGER